MVEGDDGEASPLATERLEELEERLETLTAFVGGILFEIDRDGLYLEILTGEPGLLAAPAQELRGRSIRDFLPADLAEEMIESFGRVIDTGESELITYVLDVQAGRRSFRAEIRRTSPRPRTDREPSVLVLSHDITAATELRAKLVEAERLAAMGLVAASIGHELRQPLAFATTSVEVLAREIDRLPQRDKALEALAHVRDALRRMVAIASSVGVVAPDRHRDSVTDVRRPVLAAVDLCASELQGRAVVTLDLPDLPRVRINEGELCQVLTNLLLNAAQAMTAVGTVLVRASLDGDVVLLSVTDDGCGIAPANLEKIYDPFFTTKEPGRGTGLGLFVSKRIVESAGGTMLVVPRPLVGTRVDVRLPTAAPAPKSAAPAVEPRPSPRLRLLVVDDEPSFLRSLELVLEDAHDVTICLRSADALALVRGDPTRFDVILCDLSMPDIDGVAFYQQLQELGLADRFVLMTAGAFSPRGEAFLREATCRQIAKPFTPDTLLALLTM